MIEIPQGQTGMHTIKNPGQAVFIVLIVVIVIVGLALGVGLLSKNI